MTNKQKRRAAHECTARRMHADNGIFDGQAHMRDGHLARRSSHKMVEHQRIRRIGPAPAPNRTHVGSAQRPGVDHLGALGHLVQRRQPVCTLGRLRTQIGRAHV